MPEMILYLLKVNIALLLFYAGYRFILQRYTFHTLNRFYLLVALVYSALYPLIDLNKILGQNQQLREQINILAPDWQGSVTYVINQAEDGAGNYWQIVLLVFWTGVILMSLRLLIQLISLSILHFQSRAFTLENFKFRKISKAVNPFSFWRTIYLNPECHEASELRSILEHEQVHVKQLHTFDVLLAELSTIFYWFNPGVWLMKKAIKANLEFITDEEVIRSGIDSKEYQYALLKSHVLPQNSMPVNNFHFLTIKKRIAMINKKPSNRINVTNYLLLVPSIMILVLLNGISKAEITAEQILKEITQLPEISPGSLNLSNEPGAEQIIARNTTPVSSLTSVMKEIEKSEGVTAADTNKIEVRTLNGEGNNITKLIASLKPNDTTSRDSRNIVYLIDGVRTSKDIALLSPDSILSINIFKGSGSTSIQGIETKGAIDVVSIKTKSALINETKSASSPRMVVGYAQNSNQKISLSDIRAELIFLDGKEVSKTDLGDLKVNSIDAIEVIKGSSAVAQYGEKGKGGVIVITTKKH